MTEANAAGTAKGPGIVLQPEEGESYWQPVWANGYSTVKISPKNGTLNLAILGVVNGHPIHARTALVLSNALPRSDKILSVAHLLHHLFRHSRAFGCWFRHEWFGPLVTADRGLTPTTRFQGQ